MGGRMTLPDHSEAVLAAMHAILAAYKADLIARDQLSSDALDVHINSMLEHVKAVGIPDWLAEPIRSESVSLPVGVVTRLIMDTRALAIAQGQLDDAHRLLDAAERDASTCWERVFSANRIMRDHEADYGKRARLALFEFGLTGEQGGKGASRVDHELIADHYYVMRCGGTLWEGQVLQPHSHDEAVCVIEARYGIDWESLRRAWRRKGIPVSTDAEVFPIK